MAENKTLQGTQDYSVTTTDGDITFTPGGTGKNVILDGLSYPDADGTNGQAITTDGSGNLSFTTVSGSGINNVVEDTTPQLGGDLDVDGNSLVSTSNGNITLTPNGTGNVVLGNFTFDVDQTVGAGQDNYVLTYDNASGLISLEAAPGAGGGISNIVEDTTPQLGGMLDVNGFSIGDGTLELVTFTETGSAVNNLNVTNAATGNDPVLSAVGDDTNIGLTLNAKGTGDITLGNFVFDVDQTVSASEDDYVLTYDNATGKISLEAAAGGGGGATGYHYAGTVTTAPVGTGEDTIVIGDGADGGTGNSNVCIGKGASTLYANGVAIGVNSVSGVAATNFDGVAVGHAANATGMRSISIGRSADDNQHDYSIVVGYNATNVTGTPGSFTQNNIIIGKDAKIATSNTSSGDNVVIGKGAGISGGNIRCDQSVFIGSEADIHSTTYSDCRNNVVIGQASGVQGSYNTIVGDAASVGASSDSDDYNVVIGHSADCRSGDCVVIGHDASISTAGAQSIAIGKYASADGSACVAIGYNADADNNRNVAIGNAVECRSSGYNSNYSTGIGNTFYVDQHSSFQWASSRASVSTGSNKSPRMCMMLFDVQTTNATTTAMQLDNAYFVSADNTVITGTIRVIATKQYDTSVTNVYDIDFTWCRDSGAASSRFLGTPTVTTIHEDDTDWSVAITNDTTNGRFNIDVTGEASTTINWNALANCFKLRDS